MSKKPTVVSLDEEQLKWLESKDRMGFFDRFRKSDNKNESAKDESTSVPEDNNIEEPIIREEPSGSGTYIYMVDGNKTINEHLQIIANELLIKNSIIVNSLALYTKIVIE